MEELIFVVRKLPEGGLSARALGYDINTEAADVDALRERVQEAVAEHFDEGKGPKTIRLHMAR